MEGSPLTVSSPFQELENEVERKKRERGKKSLEMLQK